MVPGRCTDRLVGCVCTQFGNVRSPSYPAASVEDRISRKVTRRPFHFPYLFLGRSALMNKPQLNLQDIFLNQVRKENIGVTIYLIGGVQLRGMVRGFDA